MVNVGKPLNDCFTLIRPMVEFSAREFLARTNNVFFFQALVPATKDENNKRIKLTKPEGDTESEVAPTHFHDKAL